VEEENGYISCFEFKWKEKQNKKFQKVFTESYKPLETKIITPSNFEEFVI